MAGTDKSDFLSAKYTGFKFDAKDSLFTHPDTLNDGGIDIDGVEQKLNTKITDAENKIKETQDQFNKKIQNSEARIQHLNKKLEKDMIEVKKGIDDSKNKTVETLAVFAALFTFLSLQVQILRDSKSVHQLMGFSLVSAGLVTFFVLILDLMIKSKSELYVSFYVRFGLLMAVSSALIIVGSIISFKP